MASSTPLYNLAFFDFGDVLSSPVIASQEIDRFFLIDKQIYGLYRIFGNGVISGWSIEDNGFDSETGISVSISTGIGIINRLAAETLNTESLDFLSPNSIINIYASITGSTPQNREVTFSASTGSVGNNAILIGRVTTSGNSVISIDTSSRTLVSFENIVQNEINSHKHRGSPTKIDLEKEVKNQLDGSRIENLESSKIQNGKLYPSRLPSFNHNELENNGLLTHAQLDTLSEAIEDTNQELLGEISSSNLLTQNIFLKLQDSSFDQFLLNHFIMIPGVTDDSNIDFTYTTANVDTNSKCIIGSRKSNTDVYFFTDNFVLPSPVRKIILTSTKGENGTVQFGVNFDNDVSFSEYTLINERQVNSFSDNINNNLRVAIKLTSDVNQTEIDFDDTFGPYSVPLNNNTIDFNFDNTGSTEVFNFRIRFYNDILLNDLAFEANTNSDVEGFAIDGNLFTLGGETILSSSTVSILYDPSSESSIDCDTNYYITIEYATDSDTFSTWTMLSNNEVFIKHCSASFDDTIDFSYTNETGSDDDFHFRVRFYSDNERTSLVSTAFSETDQTNWVINDKDTIPSTGYSIENNETAEITHYPDTSVLTIGQTYYLIIDVWDGTQFINENTDFTYVVNNANSGCNLYSNLALVRNFAFMFELEDGSLVALNQ